MGPRPRTSVTVLLVWQVDLRHSSPVRFSILILLLQHAAVLAWAAIRHSACWDELGHLVAAISHWRLGTFDLMRVNPPLVRMVATLPVLFATPKSDWRRYGAGVGARSERSIRGDFIEANGESIFYLHTLARWACVPFSLLGAYVCFRWARQLYGQLAGLLALTLWCFSPNIIAHAQLITRDAGATAMGAAAGRSVGGSMSPRL